MQFNRGNLYHIYNQGNNRQKTFFKRDNYLFFLEKIKTYVSPYTDILAWCLMPNHFHLMVEIKSVELPVKSAAKTRTLNDSIAILLRSYTRAINKQEKRSGSLFRSRTKAECITNIDHISPLVYNTFSDSYINRVDPEEQYTEHCFHYIHNNPVKAKLVENATDWEFSSAQDYAGIRKEGLVNRATAEKYIINLT